MSSFGDTFPGGLPAANVIGGYPVIIYPSAPVNPALGTAWFNGSILQVWDGTAWKDASSSAGAIYLPLAGGQMVANSITDFNSGNITNSYIDEGRY
jgi:hypothetical protein